MPTHLLQCLLPPAPSIQEAASPSPYVHARYHSSPRQLEAKKERKNLPHFSPLSQSMLRRQRSLENLAGNSESGLMNAKTFQRLTNSMCPESSSTRTQDNIAAPTCYRGDMISFTTPRLCFLNAFFSNRKKAVIFITKALQKNNKKNRYEGRLQRILTLNIWKFQV